MATGGEKKVDYETLRLEKTPDSDDDINSINLPIISVTDANVCTPIPVFASAATVNHSESSSWSSTNRHFASVLKLL
ncbi:hypothetical protein CHS0354_010720 [Potamilus streckersoni]|uniref:Uncharacterized protein n=1 Tax=Potamilus streckersoni TaxID=2493646 RepID=A0AAE0W2C8_9BIVA|nr:hypothetical protein CHS0354_010720 [Potamilus streckersoni]